jgi:hypothetical protein
MNLEELRERALASGYTKIQGDAEGAPVVSLKHWRGVSADRAGGPGDVNIASVNYYIEGNRVRVKKALVEQDFWYVLS